MWLFASDTTLINAQRRARLHGASPEDVADERERRTHARFRAFAWLLFGPTITAAAFALLVVLVRWLWS